MPIHQWLYFDAVECLPNVDGHLGGESGLDNRYDLQVSLFGADLQQQLGSLKV